MSSTLDKENARGYHQHRASTSFRPSRGRTPRRARYSSMNPSPGGTPPSHHSAKAVRVRSSQKKFKTWNPNSGGKSRLGRTSSVPVKNVKKNNVCVMVRVRPTKVKKCVLVGGDKKTIYLGDGVSETNADYSFKFDRVFTEDDNQDTVFLEAGMPIAKYALQGYNASVFAYGQTGSGKTYTMHNPGCIDSLANGEASQMGLIPRILEYVFAELSRKKESGASVVARCSMVEIYNENVYDLLDPDTRSKAGMPGYYPKPKQIREGVKRGVFVENLTEKVIENPEDATKLVEEGNRQRHVSSTGMNRESSRSHSILTIYIEIKSKTDSVEVVRFAKMNLVDLAGSERQRHTACAGERLIEAKHINKSLSALGNVISALVDRSHGKDRHVPHRNSTLTYLLKDSLGGNTKTSIITTVTPDGGNFQETLSTLKFGQRAKTIKLSVKANTDVAQANVQLLKKELLEIKEQLKLYKHCHMQGGGAGRGFLVDALEKNEDYKRIETKVSAMTDHSKAEKDTGQSVLRDRLVHLERVLVELLHELKAKRETIDHLSSTIKQKDELKEAMQNALHAKELVLSLEKRPMNAKTAGEGEALREASKILQESELQAKLALAQSENKSMKDLLQSLGISNPFPKYVDGEPMLAGAAIKPDATSIESEAAVAVELEKAKRQQFALQVQLEAVVDDKSELEHLVRDLSEHSVPEAKPARNENDLISEAQVKQLFLESGGKNEDDVDALLSPATKAPINALTETRQHVEESDAEFLQLEQEVKSAIKPRTEATRKSIGATPRRKSDDHSVHQVTRAMLLVTHKFVQEKHKSEDPETGSAGAADMIVRKRLLGQLFTAKSKMAQLEKENRRLQVKLDQQSKFEKANRRKTMKAMSQIKTDADSDNLKVLRLELQLEKEKEVSAQLLSTNKELTEAIETANAHRTYLQSQGKASTGSRERSSAQSKLPLRLSELSGLSDISEKTVKAESFRCSDSTSSTTRKSHSINTSIPENSRRSIAEFFPPGSARKKNKGGNFRDEPKKKEKDKRKEASSLNRFTGFFLGRKRSSAEQT